jgi:hypothetical protein
VQLLRINQKRGFRCTPHLLFVQIKLLLAEIGQVGTSIVRNLGMYYMCVLYHCTYILYKFGIVPYLLMVDGLHADSYVASSQKTVEIAMLFSPFSSSST